MNYYNDVQIRDKLLCSMLVRLKFNYSVFKEILIIKVKRSRVVVTNRVNESLVFFFFQNIHVMNKNGKT